MKAQDIMSKNPATVTPTTRVRQAALLMKKEDVGVVPVVEEGTGGKKLVGMLTDRDIAIRLVADGKNADECEVRDVMSANPKTARADDDVSRVMDLMGREQVRRVPIVDERGSLVGVVSQADLARKAKNEGHVERTVEQISQPGGSHQN